VEHLITDTILEYGLLAVFVLMLLESACIPVPSEVTMLFGGALANASFVASIGQEGRHLNFVAVGLAGTVGNLVGSWIAWAVGWRGCLPWTFALTALGYGLGSQWHVVERFLRPISFAIAAVVAVAAIWWLYRRWKEQRRPLPTEPDEDRTRVDR
jgi:membrane protein DedA with SNARE-associated domain